MSWFNTSSVAPIHPSIHSNCPCFALGSCFYVLHVANNGLPFGWTHVICVLCVCVTFVLALHVSHVCLFVCHLSGHRLCLSVTKRHKAHLKRLDRRWTLGGVISRQQSRGELRQMLHHLPLSLSPPPLFVVVLTSRHLLSLITLLSMSLTTRDIFVQSHVLRFLPTNAFIISHNTRRLTTDSNMKWAWKAKVKSTLYTAINDA